MRQVRQQEISPNYLADRQLDAEAFVHCAQKVVHFGCHAGHYRASIVEVEASQFLKTTADKQECEQHASNECEGRAAHKRHVSRLLVQAAV